MGKSQGKKCVGVLGGFSLAFAVVFAQDAWAGQNSQPRGNAKDMQKAAARQSTDDRSSAMTAKPQASVESEQAASDQRARDGAREGIKVHGHWTIEVKNPDGAVVTHREFENSLAPNGAGAYLLSGVLGRTFTVGAYSIELTAIPSGNNVGLTPGAGAMFFDEPGSPSITNGVAEQQCVTNPATSACSVNLTATPNTRAGTFTLAGSAVVPSSFGANVVFVGTFNETCLPTVTPQACPQIGGGGSYLTQRILDGQNGDPQPVPVSAGQTVAVTVVISFS